MGCLRGSKFTCILFLSRVPGGRRVRVPRDLGAAWRRREPWRRHAVCLRPLAQPSSSSTELAYLNALAQLARAKSCWISPRAGAQHVKILICRRSYPSTTHAAREHPFEASRRTSAEAACSDTARRRRRAP